MQNLRHLILLLLVSISLTAASIKFKVVKVIDGDTITVEEISEFSPKPGKFRVRLSDIDAPEKDQPYGIESKEKLEELLNDALVDKSTLYFSSIDNYGRIIGKIFITRKDMKRCCVNEEMLRSRSCMVL